MGQSFRIGFMISGLIALSILLALPNSSRAYQLTTPNRTGNMKQAIPGAHKANETYDVVLVGNDVAGYDIQVVAKSGLNTLKKKLEDEYKQDVKQYQDAKKDKNHRDLNLPKPVKKTIKTLKSNFKSLAEAQKFADEKIQERDKGDAKKTHQTSNKW